MKKVKKIFLLSLGIVIIIKLLCLLYLYWGHWSWYKNVTSEQRQNTRNGYFFARGEQGLYYELGYPPTESVNRNVFVKKMNFITEPDSLMSYFNKKDTIFYVERGYKWGKKTSKETRVLSENQTKYPYQIITQKMNIGQGKYFEFPYNKQYNLNIQDSILTFFSVALRKAENDTIKFEMILRDENSPTKFHCGIVKVF
ncbi:hypothetical protein ACILD6_09390 [Capnocytophaga canimorsus]|uniref:hypothetical protein n=1 Tax=Capnocytophaga canimorsus TaxID=28188 RepID=UPI0037D3A7DD